MNNKPLDCEGTHLYKNGVYTEAGKTDYSEIINTVDAFRHFMADALGIKISAILVANEKNAKTKGKAKIVKSRKKV